MRNWNAIYTPPTGSLGQTRFYRTYEELKHLNEEQLQKLNDCFYRTYEELKPLKPNGLKKAVSLEFLSYLWGIETTICKILVALSFNCFYRTYEELKPNPFFPHLVLLIPFLSYLWGIETLYKVR